MSRSKDVIERWEKQVSTPDSVTKKVIFPTDEQQFEPLETVLENLVRHEDDKAGQKGGQVTNVLLISVEGGGLEEQLEDFRRDGKKISMCQPKHFGEVYVVGGYMPTSSNAYVSGQEFDAAGGTHGEYPVLKFFLN